MPDPYRWLEDPDSEDSRNWIEAQNELTQSYLEQIPERDRIQERLTELFDFEKRGIPSRVGDWLIESRNDGLQNQSVVYRTPVGGGDADAAGVVPLVAPRALQHPRRPAWHTHMDRRILKTIHASKSAL